MNSKSIHRWLVLLATLVLWVGTAHAGRKRVVVLDFSGPKAEKFHDDVVKLVKKQHTVVDTEKWNAAAEEMDAGKVTEKNVKKLAKKLKVDAVITGKIDKRRDQYIIKLKLRSGATGEIQGNPVQTQAEGPRIDSQAQRDIKDELIAQIGDLESVGGGGDDEGDDEKPKKKKGDEGDEEKPKKGGFGGGKMKDDEEAQSKKDDDEKARKEEEKARKEEEKARKEEEKRKRKAEEEEALATKKDDEEEERPRKKKRKADVEEEDGGELTDEGEEEEEEPGDAKLRLSPGKRAVDAVLGLSFTRRNLAFTYASDLGKVPPGYRQAIPVAGALVDLTFYPMAMLKKKDITANIGLNVLYDQVLVINSRKQYLDGQGTPQTANLTTKENRWLVGGVFRYPLGKGPKAPVVGGALSFGKQTFSIAQSLPNMEATDIPNVAYTMFTPSVLVRFPITEKINANFDAGLHAITNTGAIQTRTQYGAATVSGYDIELGGDYMVTKNIFARASIRYQAINFTFKGDPMSLTHTRDTDADQDVTGAKDSYFGGTATVGYVY